jgi:thioredoxin reductase
MQAASLPVVIIGAGPVGLAAAVSVLARGRTPLVLEAGAEVGAGMRRWSHVRMFSPWEYNIDGPSAALLGKHGWTAPDPARFPTGGEMVDAYLGPLAAAPELAPHVRVNARVVAVSKLGRDRMKSGQREAAPFVVRYLVSDEEIDVLAEAVIDASGTIESPNPLGASGLVARGERAAAASVFYGIPDVRGVHRERYAGRRVLVVGSGHSAFNVLLDLAAVNSEASATTVHWAIRRASLRSVFGGGNSDQLAERGRLGLRIARLVENGAAQVHSGVHIDRIERTADGLVAWSGDVALPAVDEIVATTGFRPDLTVLAELRLGLDAATEAPTALAPLIDPNVHSCGSVPPHGAEQLKHPDANVYVAGMKSYGRAPTFLLRTGYEQVRSVVAAIAGDWEAARRVELTLPETGVCSTQSVADEADAPGGVTSSGCCDATARPTSTCGVAKPCGGDARKDTA